MHELDIFLTLTIKKAYKLVLLLSIFLVAQIAWGQSAKQLTETCVACHGTTGISPSEAFPNLAGQGEEYLFEQMLKIKSKFREIPVMAGQLSNLSEGQLRSIAQFYARQTQARGVAKDMDIELGETIYRAGIPSKSVPACTACHGPSGKGVEAASYPALAGQWSAYNKLSFERFSSAHPKDTAYIMKAITDKMTKRELESVANYIQGLRGK